MANKIYFTSDKILKLLFTGFSGFLIAKFLGPEIFGEYSIFQSVSISFFFLLSLGLDVQLPILLGKKSILKFRIINNIISIRFIFLSVYLISSLTFLYFLSDKFLIPAIIYFLSQSIKLFSIFEVYQNFNYNFKLIFQINLISFSIGFLLKYYFLINNFSLTYLCLAFLIESQICYFLFYVFTAKEGFRYIFDLKIAKYLLKLSLPLVLAGIVVDLYRSIDVFMLKYFIDSISVGEYSFASKIIMASTTFGSIIGTYSINSISKNKKSNQNDQFITSLIIGFILIFLLVIIINLTIEGLISLFFYEYLDSIELIKSLSITIFFYFTGNMFSNILIIKNLNNLIFLNALIGLLSNFILNYYLINSIGIRGAVIATIISTFISGFLFFLVIRETRKILIELFFLLTNPVKILKILKHFYETNKL